MACVSRPRPPQDEAFSFPPSTASRRRGYRVSFAAWNAATDGWGEEGGVRSAEPYGDYGGGGDSGGCGQATEKTAAAAVTATGVVAATTRQWSVKVAEDHGARLHQPWPYQQPWPLQTQAPSPLYLRCFSAASPPPLRHLSAASQDTPSPTPLSPSLQPDQDGHGRHPIRWRPTSAEATNAGAPDSRRDSAHRTMSPASNAALQEPPTTLPQHLTPSTFPTPVGFVKGVALT